MICCAGIYVWGILGTSWWPWFWPACWRGSIAQFGGRSQVPGISWEGMQVAWLEGSNGVLRKGYALGLVYIFGTPPESLSCLSVFCGQEIPYTIFTYLSITIYAHMHINMCWNVFIYLDIIYIHLHTRITTNMCFRKNCHCGFCMWFRDQCPWANGWDDGRTLGSYVAMWWPSLARSGDVGVMWAMNKTLVGWVI